MTNKIKFAMTIKKLSLRGSETTEVIQNKEILLFWIASLSTKARNDKKIKFAMTV